MRHTESLLSQSQPRSSWGNLLARRMPFDVRIPGFLLITLGVYSAFIEVLLIAGIARPAETLDWLPRLLVRAGLQGRPWISAYCWETAAESVVTGIGILRGRPWGWWLLFIFTITGLVLHAGDLNDRARVVAMTKNSTWPARHGLRMSGRFRPVLAALSRGPRFRQNTTYCNYTTYSGVHSRTVI
jgi:hypothetical protein